VQFCYPNRRELQAIIISAMHGTPENIKEIPGKYRTTPSHYLNNVTIIFYILKLGQILKPML